MDEIVDVCAHAWTICELIYDIIVIPKYGVYHKDLFTSQDAANSLWAAATLHVSDVFVIDTLVQAFLEHIELCKVQEAVNALWSLATLGVSDADVISAILHGCLDRAHGFQAQQAANALWAVASLGVHEKEVISVLAKACFYRAGDFNQQEASNALWSAAVLNISDTAVTQRLASSVSERYLSITRFDQAQQCLQAHYSGINLPEEVIQHCHVVVQTRTEPYRKSKSHLAVSAALTRLGYSPRLEVPVFNGVVTTDLVIEMPCSDSSGRLIKVSIEFDGPKHYLRPAMGSRDLVGPIDGKTRLRNALLKRSGQFEMLITVPFYEWNEVEGRGEIEEEYLKRKLSEGMRE
jgi:hypothetical protein